ncbi:MAG TPA: hypothetical protein VGV38_21125 [Pyrinomonadaceae bacterium]|nr:hypothetical protein [Pyrinomonadaceae bacterium]
MSQVMSGRLGKLLPDRLRRLVGRGVSDLVTLYRDSAVVRRSVYHAAPSAPASAARRLLRPPTVCAVFAGRNDDFVPDNEERVRAVVEWNSRVLCDEVIFVEWNPLPDRPLLSEKLTKDYANLRCYVVPAEIHARVSTNPRMPVMEYHAKNVGIRRAVSDYVCGTNSDILWDMDVKRTRWLLDERLVFRTRRVELRWDGSAPRQEYLRDPRNRVEYRGGWRQELAYGCGDFTLAHRSLWHRARGYDESLTGERISCDGRGLMQLIKLGGRPVHMGHHYHLFHGTSSVASGHGSHGEIFKYWENLPYENPPEWGLGDCAEEEVAERVWKLVSR